MVSCQYNLSHIWCLGSHASDPCSRLGGSSWLCYGIYFISEFNEMWEFLLAPPCVKSGKLAVRGWTLSQSTWTCSIYEDILQSSTKSSVVHPSTVGKSGHTDHEANRGGSAVPHDKAVALAACRQPGGCRRIPYIGSERKNSVRKTGECYKHCEEKSVPPLYRIWRIPPAY